MTTSARGVALSQKLRFAVMCEGDKIPTAYAKCIEEILSIQGLELALLIVDASVPRREVPRHSANGNLSFKSILWSHYVRATRLSSYRPVDMSQIFSGIPKIDCIVTRKGAFSGYFQPQDVDKIREYKLDFILRFAFGILRGDVLTATRYGVWSFHYGDESKVRGAPPAFWEVYHNEPITGAILQRLTDRLNGGVILQKGFIRTRKHSYAANLNAIVLASTYMPARVCRDIFNGCAEYLSAPPSRTVAPIYHNPNAVELAALFFKTTIAWLRLQLVSILFSADWNVGIVRGPIHAFLDPKFVPKVEWLPRQDAAYFIADPFLIRMGPRLKMLAEGFDQRSGRGVIVETEVEEKQPFIAHFRKILDEGVHMSYPCVFEHKGSYYCTPEAWQKRNVSLYVFDNERAMWKFAAILIHDFAAVDPTPFEYDGSWWLFCTNHDEGDEVNSKLFLWQAPDLLGPWEPHAANPVKMDVRSSRPAGRLFTFEGQLYRPAQDCSTTSGGAITINRVLRLTAQQFLEEPAAHITPVKPSSFQRGIHTVVSQDSITAIDGHRLVLAPEFVWQRIKLKLQRFAARAPRS